MTPRRGGGERERLAKWMDRNAKGMWPDRQNNRDCRKIAALLRARPRVSKRERELMELGRVFKRMKPGDKITYRGPSDWWAGEYRGFDDAVDGGSPGQALDALRSRFALRASRKGSK